jgi:hypothetical protein
MDVDVGRQRRNLIAVSTALILYKALDAKLGTVKFWGEGVVVSGENILWIALLALPYMVWRYWLYVKNEHGVIKDKAKKYLLGSGLIKGSFRRLKMGFIRENGVTDWEAYWNGVLKDVNNIFIQNEKYEVWWEKGRLVSEYSGRDELGAYVVEYMLEKLPIWDSWLCICSCYFKVILADKEFSDLYVPYVVALIAFGWTVGGML